MKWGKDPNQRTAFGVWLDQKEIFQKEVANASGLGDSVISNMCNDHTYKPTYLVFRKLETGLEKLGLPTIKNRDFW
jgi:predicted XRE-type DNA-binding protein